VEGGYGQEETRTPRTPNPEEAIPRILSGYPESVCFRVFQEQPSAPDLLQDGKKAIDVRKGFPAADVQVGGWARSMDGIDEEVEVFNPDPLVQPGATGIQAMGTAVRALVVKDDPD
jgi:hypothetical protein